MKNIQKTNTYNKRLFSGNKIRSAFHYSRFRWIKNTLKKYSIEFTNIIELGCFDGKLLDYLPNFPEKYLGLDADWEGGLELAKRKYKDKKNIRFSYIFNPEEINLKESEVFNLAVSMETFEHIPPHLVCPYLEKISKHLNGFFLITVPNEKGIFFLLKRLLKPKHNKNIDNLDFTICDIINLTLGRTNYVKRSEHKGFDYDHLIYDIRKYFDVVSIQGYSFFNFMPNFLSFGVGIIAVSKTNSQ